MQLFEQISFLELHLDQMSSETNVFQNKWHFEQMVLKTNDLGKMACQFRSNVILTDVY